MEAILSLLHDSTFQDLKSLVLGVIVCVVVVVVGTKERRTDAFLLGLPRLESLAGL